MVCCCTMAGTKACLYCNNRRLVENEYDFPKISEYDFPKISEYSFPQVERIIIEFPKVKRNIVTTTTTTSTIPYEIR